MKDTILTPRLTLKALEEKDRETMLRLLEDRDIGKTYMLPLFSGRQQKDAFFDRLQSLCRTRFVFGICKTDSGRLIGMLNECGTDEAAGEIELGYFIDPLFQKQGYATEALSAAIREAFARGFRHVVCGYFEDNTASRRVMEKCGMLPLDREAVISYLGRDRRCLYLGISPDPSL